MKILLGDFNAELGRRNIFEPTFGNESLYQDINDNGVRIVNFATSKNHVVMSTMFPHQNIHKCIWTFSDGKTQNQYDHILIDRSIRVYSMYDHSEELTVILITIQWLQKSGKDCR